MDVSKEVGMPPPSKKRKLEDNKEFDIEDQSEIISDVSGTAEKAGEVI